MSAESLQQLELELFRRQAVALSRRVREMEAQSPAPTVHSRHTASAQARRTAWSQGTFGLDLSTRLPHLHTISASADSVQRLEEFRTKELQRELERAHALIRELQAELDLLRTSAALQADQIPDYVKDLCKQLAAERGEKEKCLRIIKELTDLADDGRDEFGSASSLDNVSSIEAVLQRRVASLSKVLHKVEKEKEELKASLRIAAADANEAANAAAELQFQLEIAWREIQKSRHGGSGKHITRMSGDAEIATAWSEERPRAGTNRAEGPNTTPDRRLPRDQAHDHVSDTYTAADISVDLWDERPKESQMGAGAEWGRTGWAGRGPAGSSLRGWQLEQSPGPAERDDRDDGTPVGGGQEHVDGLAGHRLGPSMRDLRGKARVSADPNGSRLHSAPASPFEQVTPPPSECHTRTVDSSTEPCHSTS